MLPTNLLIDRGERMDAAGLHIGNAFAKSFESLVFLGRALAPKTDQFFRRLSSSTSRYLLGKEKLKDFRIAGLLRRHMSILLRQRASRQSQGVVRRISVAELSFARL